MTRKLEIFLERLETTNTVDDLASLADILRDTYDVKNVSYLATNLNGLPFVSSTYDPKWASHYEDQNYMLIDPVVRGALQHFHPMDWKRLDWSTKRTRDFYGEAVDFGVGQQGYTIPVRGPNGQAPFLPLTMIARTPGGGDTSKKTRMISCLYRITSTKRPLLLRMFLHRLRGESFRRVNLMFLNTLASGLVVERLRISSRSRSTRCAFMLILPDINWVR